MRMALIVFLLAVTMRAQPSPPPASSVSMGILGASVSAGYRSLSSLGEALAAATSTPIQLTDRSDASMFTAPRRSAQRGIDAMLASKPDVVVALDYLFWFAAGRKPDEERRADVKTALDLLDQLPGKIVLGAVPNMNGAQHRMLPGGFRPSAAALELINQDVVAWAKERPRVTVVPVDTWVAELHAGGPIVFPDGTTRTVPVSELLQPDRLHLTRLGIVLVAVRVAEVLAQPSLAVFKRSDLELSLEEVVKRLAARSAALALEVVDEAGNFVENGKLRVLLSSREDGPGAGLLAQLARVRSLSRFRTPQPLAGNNPLILSELPADLDESVCVRVRAELDDGRVSEIRELILEPGKTTRLKLVTRSVPPIVVTVRTEAGGPVSGAVVRSLTERATRQRLGMAAPGEPGVGLSGAEGAAKLLGIGPEVHRVEVAAPGFELLTLDEATPGNSYVVIVKKVRVGESGGR